MTLTPQQPGTLILGIGNPLLGDDGLGVRTAEILAGYDLPPHVSIMEAGTPGWGLATWLEGWSRAIIIDAVHMGGAPGSWRRFRPQEVRLLAQEEAISLHEPGLANGLELAQALDIFPEEILIYGVEPECCEPGQELSPAVTLALPGLVDAILSDLMEWTN